MCDAAQLDLVVIGNEELVPLIRHEYFPKDPTCFGTHRNVVQIRLIARQSAGSRNGLIETCVDSIVLTYRRQQSLCVGGPQFLGLAILEKRIDEFGPLVTNLLQRRRVGAELLGLRLLATGQSTFFEQNLDELFGGVHVEFTASFFVQ